MKRSKLIILLLLFAIVPISCKKPGKGGRATMNIYVFNGTSNVPFSTIKIAYGATGWPGANGSYNETAQADYRGQYEASEMRRGDYYIYATYTDSSSGPPYATLEGGTHFRIGNRNGERSVVVDMALEPQ